MSYTLVNTPEAAQQAYAFLSASKHIFLDCEGDNLGCISGALRLISVGTVLARRVFLFDVVALQRYALEPLLCLLQSRWIPKIVWDGRLDCIELRRTYGVELEGVLDLQLADIVSRTVRGVSDQRRKYERWHPLYSVNFLDTEGIYCLSSLRRVLSEHGVSSPGSSTGRIAHDRWMERPLLQTYLTYAAGDIYELERVFSFFQSRRYVGTLLSPKPELEVQSARYVNMHAGQPIRQGNIYQCSNLFPLDILAVPQGPRSQCEKCRRMLSRACFVYRDGPVRGPVDVATAHTSCKVCYLLDARVAENGGPASRGATNIPARRTAAHATPLWLLRFTALMGQETAEHGFAGIGDAPLDGRFDDTYYVEEHPDDYRYSESYPDEDEDDLSGDW